MQFNIIAIILLIVFTTNDFILSLHSTQPRTHVAMSLRGRSAFLGEKQEVYSKTSLRLSVDGCKAALKNKIELMEVEFPSTLSNDISVTETLNTNRAWVREFAKAFESLGKDLWVVFPDASEARLAVESKEWTGSIPFTVTSISRELESKSSSVPELIIAVNPGFNVEEWIDLPRIRRNSAAPMIIVNGNLDRLRNGYYPSLFYPGLAKVTKEFYCKFIQTFFISPVAIGGDRFGAWLTKVYPDEWELLVKRPSVDRRSKPEYDVIYASEKYPDPKLVWTTAKEKYTKDRGIDSFWGI